jgi:hypothetical protein
MDPLAVSAERLPAVPGIPFAHRGAGVLIAGPTGGGRSSLAQACLYDAARGELRCAYLGSEVGQEEFNARAAELARRRGDKVDAELRQQLARVRYLDLPAVIVEASRDPAAWIEGISDAYEVLVVDPLSAVAAALNLDFDNSNAEYVSAHERLFQPLITRGLVVLSLDNVGHAIEAKGRAKGVSAKQDRADITCSCSNVANPPGLVVRVGKVRSVRAPFARNDEWIFLRDSQRIQSRTGEHHPDTDDFRPTTIMQHVSQLIETTPGCTRNAIRDAINSKATHVDLALKLLIDEGYITREPDGQAHRHHPLKPYRQLDDNQPSPPSPNRVPTESRTQLVKPSPPSPSLKGTRDSGPGHNITQTALTESRTTRAAK